MMRMYKVYFSFGSNIGNRIRNIEKAMQLLEECGLQLSKNSSFYETSPVSKIKQGLFINMCAEFETNWPPEKILLIIKMIEKQMGRKRSKPKKHLYEEPRIIDIDVLFFDNKIINKRTLQIPHPHITKRLFVLIPLNEIIPDFMHPTEKKSIKKILELVLKMENQVV